jgi:hypothetical protein
MYLGLEPVSEISSMSNTSHVLNNIQHLVVWKNTELLYIMFHFLLPFFFFVELRRNYFVSVLWCSDNLESDIYLECRKYKMK